MILTEYLGIVILIFSILTFIFAISTYMYFKWSEYKSALKIKEEKIKKITYDYHRRTEEEKLKELERQRQFKIASENRKKLYETHNKQRQEFRNNIKWK